MNIAGLAIDRRAISMTLTRRAPDSYDPDTGKAITGVPAVIPIKAVIQPATGNQLRDLPEGVRTEAQWLLWSRSQVQLDDTVTHKGINYRVVYVWPRDEGAFYRAALGRTTK
ncbi:hypothetical protein ELG88_09780 [Rhizobium leguminosarum]|uniref:hypothetical protein n=1 Tax=Rhizobium leguminosarum TaxID=384 RepID=UPI0010326556|nr:hypothetical protein [Rhizobium leguminosarum]TAY66548.1 hypothetical protein ELH82_10305 [Rhizobium leguminosarum]TBF35475.1 hypothetical protein ELG88_09780 [Rhizobium leguminosarum]